MHKSTIIQLVLIIIGIISFFNGLESLIGNFVTIASMLLTKSKDGDNSFYVTVVLTSIVISCSYFLLSYFFISKSGRWSQWITEKSRLSSGITAHTAPADLLYFLFVLIGSYLLLKELPHFLGKVFNWFAIAVARNHETGLPPDPRSPWTQSLLSILIPILTILLAKNLASYFAGKTNSQEAFSIMEEPEQGAD